jgi:TetR/AcrR family transcriptional regulator, fatty acid biosynthesis regulator
MTGREQSKLVTRQRLLRAGMRVLADHGYERLTTGRVARRAGIAQPTFYVHFEDKDDLLRAIAAEAVDELRGALRAARAELRLGGEPLSIARQTFRLALSMITGEHRGLLRLFVGEMSRPRSAIGASARDLMSELAADLVADLRATGVVNDVPDARVALVADALVMLTVHFGMGYLSGGDRDPEPVVDLLANTAVSLLMTLGSTPPVAAAAGKPHRRRPRP